MRLFHGSEPGLSDSKDINCFRTDKISERGSFITNGTNVSGGQANVVPDHRSRI